MKNNIKPIHPLECFTAEQLPELDEAIAYINYHMVTNKFHLQLVYKFGIEYLAIILPYNGLAVAVMFFCG